MGFLLIAPLALEGVAREQVKLTCWQASGERLLRTLTTIYQEFQKENPHVEIEFVSQPSTKMTEKLIAALMAKRLPDMIEYVHDISLELEQKYGCWLDLTPYTKNWGTMDHLSKEALKCLTYEGKLYGLPSTDQTVGLYIRKSWLEKSGLDKPEDWMQLLKLADFFTYGDPDGNGKNDTYGYAMFGTMARNYPTVQFEYMMNAAGEELVENGKLNFNTVTGRFVLQWMQDLLYTFEVVPPDTANWGHTELYRDTKAGVLGIGRLGNWNVVSFDQALNEDYVAWKYPPIVKGGPNLLSSIYHLLAVSESSKNPDEAVKFIKFCLSKFGQEAYYKEYGWTSRDDLDVASLSGGNPRLMFFSSDYVLNHRVYMVTDLRWTEECKRILARHIHECLVDPEAVPIEELAKAEKEISSKFYK
jgi:multiple sugar transport system substrate-binding protein